MILVDYLYVVCRQFDFMTVCVLVMSTHTSILTFVKELHPNHSFTFTFMKG